MALSRRTIILGGGAAAGAAVAGLPMPASAASRPLRADPFTLGVASGDPEPDGFVPFHKLSQWLAYSLAEIFEDAGIPVTALDDLTGLPEYRNGGLLLDLGVIALRDPALAEEPLPVDHPLRSQPNTVLTPHAAFYSEKSIRDLQRLAAEEAARAGRGEPLRCPIN